MKQFQFLFSFVFAAYLSYGQQVPLQPNVKDNAGLRQGIWKEMLDRQRFETKQKDSVVYYRLLTYVDDLPVDTVTEFYPSGKLFWKGILQSVYPKIQPVGTCFQYRENGTLQIKNRYEGNELKETYAYKPDGKTVDNTWLGFIVESKFRLMNTEFKLAIKAGEEAYNRMKVENAAMSDEFVQNAILLSWCISMSGKYNIIDFEGVTGSDPEAKELQRTIQIQPSDNKTKVKANHERAEKLLAEALTTNESLHGKSSPSNLRILEELVSLSFSSGKNEEGIYQFRKLDTLTQKTYGAESASYSKLLRTFSRRVTRKLNNREKEAFLLHMASVHEKANKGDSAILAEVFFQVGRELSSQHKYNAAKPWLLKANAISPKMKDHNGLVNGLFALQDLYESVGDYRKAESILAGLEIKAAEEGQMSLSRLHQFHRIRLNYFLKRWKKVEELSVKYFSSELKELSYIFPVMSDKERTKIFERHPVIMNFKIRFMRWEAFKILPWLA